MMRLSVNPIGPWALIILGAVSVLAATWWAYRVPVRSGVSRLRWVVVGLRIVAVLLCLAALLRPSVLIAERKTESALVLMLVDSSTSMTLTDEVGGRSRWEVALETVQQARAAIERIGGASVSAERIMEEEAAGLQAQYYRFDGQLTEWEPSSNSPKDQEGDQAASRPGVGVETSDSAQDSSSPKPPEGRETALGSMLAEALRRHEGKRIAAMVVVSDGASNSGRPPLTVAEQFKARGIPITSVGLGSDRTGPEGRDIAVREIVTAPTVFVKNELQVRGTVRARGFANVPLEVELLADGVKVASTRITARGDDEILSVRDLKHVFETPGEKRLTLRVEPLDGETLRANNEVGTYLDVLKGGLAVLYLQGPNFSWEYKYLVTSLDTSPDIQVDLAVLRRPATATTSELPPDALQPGKYDVFVLGDFPARLLTTMQQRQLADRVDQGAGLIMLGGRDSLGPGGWRDTALARILPVEVHPGDGDTDPPGGIKVVPNPDALDAYVMKLASNLEESRAIWEALPPIPGASNLNRPKIGSSIWATSPDRRPLLVAQEIGLGRSMVFAGETWVWARASEASFAAHRRLWRQIILWLARKEETGENEVKLTLDRRGLRLGQKLDLTIQALDGEKTPIPDASFQAEAVRLDANGLAVPETNMPIDLYKSGAEARGSLFATGEPGEYRITATARDAQGEILGTDSARFLLIEDDRELENPAANLALLKQLASITGGEFLPPDKLGDYLEALHRDSPARFEVLTEHRIYDNWPYFLAFVTVLTLEWALRRRIGWV
ncbi:protein of unknown function DUF1355 [Isosphaera pallida ATCC 43644]|uniref:VWFA domain-containing protein n=1 Tax=Isosphaera pallida (strain ATCC 43644 / DSM 9630 / IS1B) TaxID=575540 RepID=E8QYN4_ISOPI|nr:glutamine amidotransferase [Isosphaera pallida]ADV61010.1 protein of unknown function DUF1355 [Isosphaera pallida ATCC 43644]